VDLRSGRERWHSLALLDDCRVLVPSADRLIALTQDGRYDAGDARDVSHIRIFAMESGEEVKQFRLPKRWVHRLDHQDGQLTLWDCTFLYHVAPPPVRMPAGRRPLLLDRREAPPDAIAALRKARDLEEPVRLRLPQLPGTPRIDGDLSDWPAGPGAATRRLETVLDWKPDFAHRSRAKSRAYGGREDLAATVRAGRAGSSLCLAVAVTDDAHVAAPGPGLWRSDSITLLLATGGGEEVDPTLLTVALVDAVPRFELGTAVEAAAASDHPGREPDSFPGPRRFEVPPPGPGGATLLPPGSMLEIAVRRDDEGRRTVYEISAPIPAVVAGRDLYWDIIVNENDGRGREGALQLASSVWGVEETAIGGAESLR
jgi:hypothetical protein